ncbi:hypothetical protein B1219_27870 [Pseudomonas ogarae]|uniref:DUF2806 domain-containing protein n=1 Tax=Pseudomonas ogarae (strain DSM 112162 / CECT 30235 / F113) TaxID=1114970 RepID=UPI0009A42725|nr:DUF2806 domain-containing protein [Pseudomonas ogarae]OPG69106.1 hypothetical protein B1219_27870 [Pseudomonas ogarae]
MRSPGEHLLGKMWDTLANKGIGALLKPAQIRRERLADIEMDRVKTLANAQAQRDAQDIKEGRKSISDFSSAIDIKKAKLSHEKAALRIEPSVDYELACEVGLDSLIHDSVRREVNVANAIIYAEETLRNDSDAAPEENIDEDWLYKWRDYTGEISNDDLQKIWGRLLAGEIKAPGSYSVRCLESLRNLSQTEAKLIARLSSFVFLSAVWRPDETDFVLPVSFQEFVELQEIGIISGAEAANRTMRITDIEPAWQEFRKFLICHDKCLIVTNANKASVLSLSVYNLTKVGQQLMSLGEFRADVPYLTRLGEEIISQGYEVAIADVVESDDYKVTYRNQRKLTITRE